MTKSQRIDGVTGTLVLALVALQVWKPAFSWAVWAACGILVIGSLATLAVSTPADAARRRRTVWIIPLSSALIGAQWVYFATPEERTRSIYLAAGLVAMGVALALTRLRVRSA